MEKVRPGQEYTGTTRQNGYNNTIPAVRDIQTKQQLRDQAPQLRRFEFLELETC